jgi:hypothetical protein
MSVFSKDTLCPMAISTDCSREEGTGGADVAILGGMDNPDPACSFPVA